MQSKTAKSFLRIMKPCGWAVVLLSLVLIVTFIESGKDRNFGFMKFLVSRHYQTAYLALKGDPDAQNNLAVLLQQGQWGRDAAEADKWYRRAADQNHAKAQYNLGYMYRDGRGVPQDFAEAYVWFSLAASNGIQRSAMLRDSAARMMTAEQMEEAERRAAEWKAKAAAKSKQ